MLVFALASYLPVAIVPFTPAPADGSQAAMLAAMARILVPVYYIPALAYVLWPSHREPKRTAPMQ